MSDTARLTQPTGALFEVLIGTMKMVERSLGKAGGTIKRETVLTMLVSQGLIKEDQREPVGVLVDGFIFAARNHKLLTEFARKECSSCLPF